MCPSRVAILAAAREIDAALEVVRVARRSDDLEILEAIAKYDAIVTARTR